MMIFVIIVRLLTLSTRVLSMIAGGSEPTRKIMLKNCGQNTPSRITITAARR